ncbi:MAG: Vitamin B12 transporter BtuB [Steroidobacteraceae bacterium]|nr:Vitamin B12 transporter BtuB [Steroidobacteraceae bacterium]
MTFITLRRLTALPLAVAALALASPPAWSQLEEIVVTARKQEERLQDVPIAVAAFSNEQLEERGARDMFDVSHFTPGFSFEKVNRYGVQGGVSRPVIRGMSNILGEGNASVFVDGILYSDSILSFPFDIVDRVEVIKGPQAALFGRATFSGAINLITKKGSNEPEHTVSARLAEYGDTEVNLLSRGAVVPDKLFYMVHGRYYSMDGMYRNTLDRDRIGGEQSTNFNASLEWRPTEGIAAILSGGYTRDRDDLAAITLQDRFANNCYLNVARQYYCGEVQEAREATLDRAGLQGTDGLHRDSTRLSLQLTFDLPAGLTLVSNSGLFNTEMEYGYDSTYQGATAFGITTVPNAPGYTRAPTDPVRTGGVLRNEVTDRDEWSTELRLQSDPAGRFRYMLGAYYYESRRSLEERHFLPTAPTVFSGESRIDNQAIFGSLGFDITDRWEATAELRYAEDTIGNYNAIARPAAPLIENTFDSVSPRVTTTFKLTQDNMVYANIAKGNKPGVINADPRFPPDIRYADEESSWNYEVGTKNRFLGGRLMANLALYYIDWKDQQLTASYTFPTGGTQSYIRNAGKTEIKGAELELEAAVTDQFTAGFTWSLTDAKFKELFDAEAGQLFGNTSLVGKMPAGVPEQQASAYGRVRFPVGTDKSGFVRGDISYTDRKFDQIFDLAHTGEQVLLNMSAGVENDHWAVTFFVNNLTDDRTPSSVTRYVDQLNLNVPQHVNANPAQNNVPGTTTLERAFFYPLANKRQFGITAKWKF